MVDLSSLLLLTKFSLLILVKESYILNDYSFILVYSSRVVSSVENTISLLRLFLDCGISSYYYSFYDLPPNIYFEDLAYLEDLGYFFLFCSLPSFISFVLLFCFATAGFFF